MTAAGRAIDFARRCGSPRGRWPWPLPAVGAWAAAWLAYAGLASRLPASAALAAGCAVGVAFAWRCDGGRRRAIAAAGFPLSAALAGAGAGDVGWPWLAALLPLAALYPPGAWRDAPLFPTPARALDGLAAVVGTPAAVLDAGCGAGAALVALHRLWPQARIDGVERSALLARWAARRCRFAAVAHGDLWRGAWRGYDVVYLFQRPESMPRAWAKASAEMARGAWLVSLEFAVPGVSPYARIDAGKSRSLWVYRVGHAA